MPENQQREELNMDQRGRSNRETNTDPLCKPRRLQMECSYQPASQLLKLPDSHIVTVMNSTEQNSLSAPAGGSLDVWGSFIHKHIHTSASFYT